jgi:hemerythrin superfamily protein
MSIVDKVVAAVTPLESQQEREDARAKARAAAAAGDWLSLILEHHELIENAFAAVEAAADPSQRVAAQKELAVLLTGHSNAEESVIYPALVRADEKGHATMAYTEQAAAKMEMGELETLQPTSQEYLDKLRHIRGAVAHHVYEEESAWFLELKDRLPEDDQAHLTQRYQEEFERYVGGDKSWKAGHLGGERPLAGSRPHSTY